MSSFDPDKQLAKGEELVKVNVLRWFPDWINATPLFEKAGDGFVVEKKLDKAMIAYEKASIGREKLSSHLDAAMLKEAAADIAEQLGLRDKVLSLYVQASGLYIKCNTPKPSADALLKAARFVEGTTPAVAVGLWLDAASILEEQGEEYMAFNLYQRAADGCITLGKCIDAAAVLVRSGRAAAKCNDTNSQNKANLGAIIVYLYADDLNKAEKCYNDCSKVDTFQRSYQSHFASKLISFYKKGKVEEIKHLSCSGTISKLDPWIIKLAKELPTGDLRPMKTNAAADDQQPVDEDEDDLT